MLRNVVGQKFRVIAYDPTDGSKVTGDAANITARITKDHGTPAATNDVNPTEVDATNEPGIYAFDLTQAETDAFVVEILAKSATATVEIAAPLQVYPRPQYFSVLGIESDGDLTKVNTLNGHTPQSGDNFPHSKRYNTVRHVGSGQTHSTIAAAQTAASAGDLIVIHAGTYNEAGLGKQDVTYYFLPGAIINYTGSAEKTFKTSISNTRFRVLGHGRFVNATGQCFYNDTGGAANIYVECDSISGAAIYTDQSGASIIVKARRAISGTPFIETSGFDNMCLIDCPDMHTTNQLAVVNSTDAHAVFVNARIICSGVTPIGGTDGVVILRNVYFSADAGASGNGLNSPGNVRLICESGGVYQAQAGRPSFSGAGIIEASAGFAYDPDPAASTHTGTFIRNAQFPLAQVDSGATAPLRTGADGDTGKTLSDQIDAAPAAAAVAGLDIDYTTHTTPNTPGEIYNNATDAAELAQTLWENPDRILTAGTNIVLAKGTGVTGFNDLSQQQARDAMKLAPTAGAAGSNSLDDYLSTTLPDQIDSSQTSIEATVDNVPAAIRTELATELGTITTNLDAKVSEVEGGGGGDSTDVNQKVVSPANTWILRRDDTNGWSNLAVKTLVVGKSDDFVIDFREWLASTGAAYLTGTPTFAIFSGTAGGVTFSAEGKLAKGAKARFTGVTAGTYIIACNVTSNSGATQQGRVQLTLIPATAP